MVLFHVELEKIVQVIRLLIEDTTNRILGAHLLGTHAEEVINIFALAIRLGLGAEVIKKGIYTYPTNSYDITYML